MVRAWIGAVCNAEVGSRFEPKVLRQTPTGVRRGKKVIAPGGHRQQYVINIGCIRTAFNLRPGNVLDQDQENRLHIRVPLPRRSENQKRTQRQDAQPKLRIHRPISEKRNGNFIDYRLASAYLRFAALTP